MRLLFRNESGKFALTKEFMDDDQIPEYAILSHTWGADNEEVTFQDITSSEVIYKPGFEKIQFCGEQAKLDNLSYWWVDTCCINKRNEAELSRSINSMFRWYQNAAKCYVYLSDVSARKRKANVLISNHPWETAFRESRWFTRGWTLQELLAPASVEFFSRECDRLGDKNSLKTQIYEITNVPHAALQGHPLSQFSVEERLRWIHHRHTKEAEDKAYSLLGIFDVYILPDYGEGAANAHARLLDEYHKIQKCIQDLCNSDPRDDKKRIEGTKGGLLEGLCEWILENPDFQYWCNDQRNRLLWVKGDPGKGKTMLLCKIINELERSKAKSVHLSYFFCQATDLRINHAPAVLRGLIFMLVVQQPSLTRHIRKRYDQAGKMLFEDANAWIALSEILTNILQDPNLNSTYIIIDALDECVVDLLKLLDFVDRQSSASSRVKWLVSSRNLPEIEGRLELVGQNVRLSLELNAKSVSTAVNIFIEQKVAQLAQQKKYDNQTRSAVLKHLKSKANDTFLWVALVCQNLETTAKRNVVKNLESFPPGLNTLYERMIQQVNGSEDAELCKHILALITLVYRPITLRELTVLATQLEDNANDLETIQEIIGLCGSFLALRDGIIYFVHQSAKDFLLTSAGRVVFPAGKEEVHHLIFARSLEVMSRTLHRDLYCLKKLGYPTKDIEQPSSDPLAVLRYLCIYWVDHLYDSNPISSSNHLKDLQDRGIVHEFLSKKYLYWLEALSLCKSIPAGVVSVTKLWSLVLGRGEPSFLSELVHDAYRFIMYHKGAIENSPLQAYASALLFSPTGSLVRQLFQHEEPEWITIKPDMDDSWSACLQVLEGHSYSVTNMTFSHDSTRLASGSRDRTVKIWDLISSQCLYTLKGHNKSIISVAFSYDSTQLLSASGDSIIKIWDTSNGTCLRTLGGQDNSISSVAFSHDLTRVLCANNDNTIILRDIRSGQKLLTLKCHCANIRSVAFSHDSTQLASVSSDDIVKIWDTSSGKCLQTIKGHSSHVSSVVFSQTTLVSASRDETVKIWDISSGKCLQTLGDHDDFIRSIAVSHDSTRLASASDDGTMKIWDASNGQCVQTLEANGERSIAFSPDSTKLASALSDGSMKIWDMSSNKPLQDLERHNDEVCSVTFSHDMKLLASGSEDMSVKIWDTTNGKCLYTLEGHSDSVYLLDFSHDTTRLASGSGDGTIIIWEVNSGKYLWVLEGHKWQITSIAFSHDLTLLASASLDKTIKIWNTINGHCLYTLNSSSQLTHFISVAFSHDSTQIISTSYDQTFSFWDTSRGRCLQTHDIGQDLQALSLDTTGSCLHTNIGSIAINTLNSSSTTNILEPQQLRYLDVGISSDNTWITCGGNNILWVPIEYRAYRSALGKKQVGIGASSGRVWICNVDFRSFYDC